MKKIYSDAGHGGTDPGASGGGFSEKWGTLKMDTVFSNDLSKDFKVKRTRTDDRYVSLQDRAKNANNFGADICVSHHMNAANKIAEGIEVLYISQEGKKLAKYVLDELWATGIFKKNRGLKYRPDLYMTRMPKMPSIIIEYGFVDNDAERARVYPNFEKLALASASGVRKYLNNKSEKKPNDKPINKPDIKEEDKVENLEIISKSRCKISQMVTWAKKKNATKEFIDLAPIFYYTAKERGIDPAIVYAQSAKETGYMKFGGVLDASFKNPCGLKITQGGGDTQRTAHKRFNTWEEGIAAQVDHLALYAGQEGYPKVITPDPRHFPFLKGTAKTTNELGGKWAPSYQYGKDLTKMALEIINTPFKEEIIDPDSIPSDYAKEAWEFVEKEGLMSGAPRRNMTREECAMVIYRMLMKK